jgi:hypothetical protein
MPISQAPSRKPKMDREIREYVNLYGWHRPKSGEYGHVDVDSWSISTKRR